MKNFHREYEIKVPVMIYYAPDFLSKDVAMIDLLEGVGDRNTSKYTKEEFIDLIKSEKVLVVMLREDPIAYAIVDEKKDIEEVYVSYSFKNAGLEDLFRDFIDKDI